MRAPIHGGERVRAAFPKYATETVRRAAAGDPKPVSVPRDDGSKQQIFRCPDCQIALFSEYGRPEVLFVRAGTLDEPGSVAPDVHIYTSSKLPWVALPESVPAFEVFYDTRKLWPPASLEQLDAVLQRARAD